MGIIEDFCGNRSASDIMNRASTNVEQQNALFQWIQENINRIPKENGKRTEARNELKKILNVEERQLCRLFKGEAKTNVHFQNREMNQILDLFEKMEIVPSDPPVEIVDGRENGWDFAEDWEEHDRFIENKNKINAYFERIYRPQSNEIASNSSFLKKVIRILGELSEQDIRFVILLKQFFQEGHTCHDEMIAVNLEERVTNGRELIESWKKFIQPGQWYSKEAVESVNQLGKLLRENQGKGKQRKLPDDIAKTIEKNLFNVCYKTEAIAELFELFIQNDFSKKDVEFLLWYHSIDQDKLVYKDSDYEKKITTKSFFAEMVQFIMVYTVPPNLKYESIYAEELYSCLDDVVYRENRIANK